MRPHALACPWTLFLAGLAGFALTEPRAARAQAEEIPPEPAPGSAISPPAPQSPAPQATDAPKPAAQPASSHGSVILFVPYLGVTVPMGDGWEAYNASPRFGALLGWRATDRLSINAECDVDYVRTDLYVRADSNATSQPGGKTSYWDGFLSPPRHYIDLSLSPLVSLRAGQIRLGPKVGWFTSSGYDEIWSAQGGVTQVPAIGSGLLFGFNLGLFVPYRNISIGGLLTGSFRYFTSVDKPIGAYHTIGILAAVLL